MTVEDHDESRPMLGVQAQVSGPRGRESTVELRQMGPGRTVDEWKIRAGRPDNHWLHCLVGCAAAASIQGVVLYGTDSGREPERRGIRLSELHRKER